MIAFPVKLASLLLRFPVASRRASRDMQSKYLRSCFIRGWRWWSRRGYEHGSRNFKLLYKLLLSVGMISAVAQVRVYLLHVARNILMIALPPSSHHSCRSKKNDQTYAHQLFAQLLLSKRGWGSRYIRRAAADEARQARRGTSTCFAYDPNAEPSNCILCLSQEERSRVMTALQPRLRYSPCCTKKSPQGYSRAVSSGEVVEWATHGSRTFNLLSTV